jgi:hypothetical protein
MSSPAVLVTLAQAKEHLRIFHTEEDGQIQDKLDAAEDAVLDYMDMATPIWDDTNVPPRVQAAILLVLGDLWEHRGDTGETMAFQNRVADGEFHPRVTALLHRLRSMKLA